MAGRTLQFIVKITLLAFVFYQIARLEFLVWNWSYLAQEPFSNLVSAWVNGLRFDLSGVFAVSLPWVLATVFVWGPAGKFLSTVIKYGVILFHSLFFILSLIDVEFIHFLGRRSTADTLVAWQEVPGKMGGFLETYWHLYLVNTCLFVLFWWLALRFLKKEKARTHGWPRQVGLIFVFLFVSVLAIRGGFQKKPLSFVNSNLFTNFYLNNLVLNSSFTFAKSLGNQKLQKQSFYEDQEAALEVIQKGLSASTATGVLKGSSVILIILESFGTEYTGRSGETSYTPFFDQLEKKSLSIPNSFASGRRSIEGIASLLTGLPVLMSEPFISSQYASQPLIGLPSLLREQGYSTQFFHGGLNGTMHFDTFSESIGFEKYYGFNEYGKKDFDGTWGAWDRPFFQQVIREIDIMKKPFFVTLFSLSSHHPFRVPEGEAQNFPEGPIPILKSVRYTDSALQDFFQEIEKYPWYQDTLFILTADHTSTHYLKNFTNLIGSYEVPLLFYHPKVDLRQLAAQSFASHVDVMPTVLDLLEVSRDQALPFGSSVFQAGTHVSAHYLDGQYILFSKDHYLTVTDWENPKVFDIKDRNGESPISLSEEHAELFSKLKAQVQFFNNGLEQNQLSIPKR